MVYFSLAAFIFCATFVQFRGKVRYKRLSLYFNEDSDFLSPVNCLFYAFPNVDHTPYLDANELPELNAFHDYQASNNDIYLPVLFYRRGWERFGLIWYGNTFRSAEVLCPITLSLIHSVPSVRMAMFTNLSTGKHLMPIDTHLQVNFDTSLV